MVRALSLRNKMSNMEVPMYNHLVFTTFERIPIDPMSASIVTSARPYTSKWLCPLRNVLETHRSSLMFQRNRPDNAAAAHPPYRSDTNDKFHPNTNVENDCAATELAVDCENTLHTG